MFLCSEEERARERDREMHKKIDRETKAGESHLPKGFKEPFLGAYTERGRDHVKEHLRPGRKMTQDGAHL